MACFRIEQGTRKRNRRFFYHFNVVEVVQSLKGGAKIVVEEVESILVNTHLWIQTNMLEALLAVSNFDFIAELPKSARWGRSGDFQLAQCNGSLTRQSFILMAKEVDALDIKVDTKVEDPFEDPFQSVECPSCSGAFESEETMRGHMVRAHPGAQIPNGPTKCDICSLDCESVITLGIHFRNTHMNQGERVIQGGPPCPQCGEILYSQVELRHHMMTRHHANPNDPPAINPYPYQPPPPEGFGGGGDRFVSSMINVSKRG